MMRSCRISSDRTMTFVFDELEDTLVAKHITATTQTVIFCTSLITELTPNITELIFFNSNIKKVPLL